MVAHLFQFVLTIYKWHVKKYFHLQRRIYTSRFYSIHFGIVCVSQEDNIITSKWTRLTNDYRSCLVVAVLVSELTKLTAVFLPFSFSSRKYRDGDQNQENTALFPNPFQFITQ